MKRSCSEVVSSSNSNNNQSRSQSNASNQLSVSFEFEYYTLGAVKLRISNRVKDLMVIPFEKLMNMLRTRIIAAVNSSENVSCKDKVLAMFHADFMEATQALDQWLRDIDSLLVEEVEYCYLKNLYEYIHHNERQTNQNLPSELVHMVKEIEEELCHNVKDSAVIKLSVMIAWKSTNWFKLITAPVFDRAFDTRKFGTLPDAPPLTAISPIQPSIGPNKSSTHQLTAQVVEKPENMWQVSPTYAPRNSSESEVPPEKKRLLFRSSEGLSVCEVTKEGHVVQTTSCNARISQYPPQKKSLPMTTEACRSDDPRERLLLEELQRKMQSQHGASSAYTEDKKENVEPDSQINSPHNTGKRNDTQEKKPLPLEPLIDATVNEIISRLASRCNDSRKRLEFEEQLRMIQSPLATLTASGVNRRDTEVSASQVNHPSYANQYEESQTTKR